ncbi:type IV secretion system protein VirB10 [Anaeromyxobacter paludicola]|uniref:type IV secretion system protein VirB10 n=1 Tax=Anaeromyxobacter paludicola TaxID=2918171 RepID=UPI0020BD877B|nr:type IV secretion system protein VirB10 [Anaeromyxobacter paludicola]
MTEIDAGAVLDERDREREAVEAREQVEGARGKAQLGGARRPWPVGARTFLVLGSLVALAFASALLLKARSARRESEARREDKASERVEKRVPALKLAAPAEAPAPVVPTGIVAPPIPLTGVETAGPAAPAETDPLQRRLSRGFGPTEGESSAPTPPPGRGPLPQLEAPAAGAHRANGLEEKLEPVELKGAAAGRLPDRDYLVTQGAMLDCVLETKVVSTVAGMTSCYLTRDVYSTNGRVVLLDRGSRVVGRYQGGVRQGEARIFILWTRVETPSGVVVDLQSPGTGALGEAGVGGAVDTHFWDRFGAAILLSVIEDGADAAAARAGGAQQGTNITVANTANAGKEVVARSLEPTVNIPPTLYVNQGERVGILVARDLDFRGVYGLEQTEKRDR